MLLPKKLFIKILIIFLIIFAVYFIFVFKQCDGPYYPQFKSGKESNRFIEKDDAVYYCQTFFTKLKRLRYLNKPNPDGIIID